MGRKKIKNLDNIQNLTYISGMRCITRTILFIAFIGFIGIQFATLIDDPQHLVEPDPNCPICLAAKTEVYIDTDISISFTPDIILYLVDHVSFSQDKENYFSIKSIRAPPIS